MLRWPSIEERARVRRALSASAHGRGLVEYVARRLGWSPIQTREVIVDAWTLRDPGPEAWLRRLDSAAGFE